LTCKKFVKCVSKTKNLYKLQLPSIVTSALHFGNINKGNSDNIEIIFK
jgi:hypothetical protein